MRRYHILVLILLASVSCGCRQQNTAAPSGVDPFPSATDVVRVEGEVFDREQQKQIRVELPLDQWPAIRAALLPAHSDPEERTPWEISDELFLTTADGGTFYIMMSAFENSSGDVQFAAGETIDKREYYQGGNSQRAYEAVKSYRDLLEAKEKELR